MATIPDDFEILSDAVHSIEDSTYAEIRKLALTSTAGLQAWELRLRLEAIADMIRLRERCRELLQHFVNGEQSADAALAQMRLELRQLFGTKDQYSDCPDEDDLDPDPQ
jgi:hypothetical protein